MRNLSLTFAKVYQNSKNASNFLTYSTENMTNFVKVNNIMGILDLRIMK